MPRARARSYAEIGGAVDARAREHVGDRRRRPITAAELEAMGYKLVIFPSTRPGSSRRRTGSCAGRGPRQDDGVARDRFTSFDDVNALLGLADWQSR